MGNYRPISLLPAISKFFEKVVYQQLYNYFTVNKLFYEGQYGFKNNHACELANMPSVSKTFKFILFAGDTNLLTTIEYRTNGSYHYGFR